MLNHLESLKFRYNKTTIQLFHSVSFRWPGVYRKIISPFPNPVNRKEFWKIQTSLTPLSVKKIWNLWHVHSVVRGDKILELVQLPSRHFRSVDLNSCGACLVIDRHLLDDRRIIWNKYHKLRFTRSGCPCTIWNNLDYIILYVYWCSFSLSPSFMSSSPPLLVLADGEDFFYFLSFNWTRLQVVTSEIFRLHGLFSVQGQVGEYTPVCVSLHC